MTVPQPELATAPKAVPATGLLHGRIPSLDGMRAISIALVLIGHGSGTVPGVSNRLHELLLNYAQLGVTVFFVVSGFLITSLLYKELRQTGTISLKSFYIRRAFRIWPAFYALIAFVVLLGVLKIIELHPMDVVAAGGFFWNYYQHGFMWFLGHTWSLSVEEQFYLLWPFVLVMIRERRAVRLAVAILAIEPFLRVGTYLLMPERRPFIGMMLHTRADALMAGALVALLYGDRRFEAWVERLFAWKLPVLLVPALLIDPVAQLYLRGGYVLSFSYTFQNLSIVLLMLWAIRNPGHLVGRTLHSPLAVHIGYLSFSLYLWQQIFLTVYNHTITGRFPLNLAFAFLAAECSYRFIEKPFLRWRKRFAADMVTA